LIRYSTSRLSKQMEQLRTAISAVKRKLPVRASDISVPYFVRVLLVAGSILVSWLLASRDPLQVLRIASGKTVSEQRGNQFCPFINEESLTSFQIVPYLRCGRSRLFQVTGLLHLLVDSDGGRQGSALQAPQGHEKPAICAALMTPVSLWFQNCGSYKNISDLDVNAWLEGPNIVPATISMSHAGFLSVTFLLLEPGDYFLFVKLLWINGSNAEQGSSAYTYLGGQRGNGQSGPFHNPVPEDIQCHENNFLIGSPFHVIAKPMISFPYTPTNSALSLESSSTRNSLVWTSPQSAKLNRLYHLSNGAQYSSRQPKTPVPLCTGSKAVRSALRTGLWSPAVAGEWLCTEHPKKRNNSETFVFDEWNPGWLWTGHNCSFQLYGCEDMCSRLRHRKIERIFVGRRQPDQRAGC
jgi:hypothetical protein